MSASSPYSGLVMKRQQACCCSRFIAVSLLTMMLSLSTLQAREPVTWNDLGKKIGHGRMRPDNREDREYRVITKDGAMHVGRPLYIQASGIRLGEAGLIIPREQVAEIRIHCDRRWRDALLTPGGVFFSFFVGSDEYWILSWRVLLLPALLPATVGVVAASAPVALPVEAIRRRLPDKVVRVAP